MMRAPVFDSYHCEGLAVIDLAALQAKLTRIRKAGADKLYLCVDWDKTIVDDSVWRQVRQVLPDRIRQQHEELSRIHLPKLNDHSMTTEEAVAWQTAALDLLAGTHIDAIIDAVSNIPLRPGAKELFTYCEERGIPTIIRSAVFRDAIEAIAKKQRIRPSLIIATNLIADQQGVIRHWDPQTLTHDLNKHSVTHNELPALLKNREHAVVLGDRMQDTLLAGDHHALRIRVDGDFTPSKQRWQAHLAESFTAHEGQYPFDAVTTHDSLLPVTNLVRWLTW